MTTASSLIHEGSRGLRWDFILLISDILSNSMFVTLHSYASLLLLSFNVIYILISNPFPAYAFHIQFVYR